MGPLNDENKLHFDKMKFKKNLKMNNIIKLKTIRPIMTALSKIIH